MGTNILEEPVAIVFRVEDYRVSVTCWYQSTTIQWRL